MDRDFSIKKIKLDVLPVQKEKTNKNPEKNTVRGDTMVRTTKKTVKKRIIKILGVLLLVILVVYLTVIMPMQKVIAIGKEAVVIGREAAARGKDQDLPGTREKLGELDTKLAELQKSYKKTIYLKYIPIISGYYSDGENSIIASQEFVKAGIIAVDEITPYADLLGFSKGDSSFVNQPADQRIETAVKTFEKVTPKLTEIDEHLEVAKIAIDKINPKRYPSKIGKTEVRPRIVAAQSAASDGIAVFLNARPLLEILPNLLGQPDPKRYLVLFQNDKELRATGGFITAFALFTVDKGKFIVETSEDIYRLDERQIKRVAAPPEILKYHKGVYYAYLRDSNISPDFYESMQRFEDLYNNVSGKQSYDGIITVDTHVLVAAMKVLDGKVFIPEYNANFTVEPDPRCDGCPQVVYELEAYADQPVGYFKGERKDILGRLMLALMQKSLGVSPGQYWGPLMQTFFEQMNQKHILFYMHDEKAQQAVEALNYAGRINQFDGDYLHINDVNFAGAKSNMFVKESVKQEIEIGKDGAITKTLTIDYKNPSQPSNCNLESGQLCLNGLLRNWIRIYVPKGSTLVSITGANAEGIEPDTIEDLDKTVFEGFLTVRPLGSAQVIVKYQLPFKAGKTYNVLIQKQPGTDNNEYTIVLNGREVDKFNLTVDREFSYSL